MMKKFNLGIKFNNLVYRRINLELIPICFGFLGFILALISICFIANLSKQAKYVPYLVTVDKLGSILYQGEIKSNEAITDEIIASQLCEFIESLYSVVSDKDLQISYINKIYAKTLVNSDAQTYLDDYFNKNNVFNLNEHISQKVSLNSISRISNKTFQIDFDLNKSNQNEQISKESFKATLSYNILKINHQNINELKLNPLGIYVDEITISKKIEA